MVFQGQDEISSGLDVFMAGTSKNGVRRGLIAFDFDEDDFPSDAKVECAEIRLHAMEAPKGGELTLHRITTAWKTSGKNVIHGVNGGRVWLGDTTWSYTDYPSSVWNNEGGDYSENVVATKVSSDNNIHSYGNTLRMARLVQEWIDVKSKPFNAGFILIGEEAASPGHYVKYSGAENAPHLIPRLIVTYTSPSQGKEHRDYTAYLPEVPVKSMQNTEEAQISIAAQFSLVFIGGILFGCLVGIAICVYRNSGKVPKESGDPNREPATGDAQILGDRGTPSPIQQIT